mgnify:CR=1 FL=1
MQTNKSHHIFRQFNETIEKWIISLDDYTLDMLLRKPAKGSWSLGQVYVHIVEDTKYFVQRMTDALANDANAHRSMHEDARTIFHNNGFPDAQLTGPATDDNVRQPGSKTELLQGLLFIQDEVNKLYAAYNLEGAAGKTEHPGLGFFTAPEWLQFAEMHLRHHFRQKKRIDDLLTSASL